MSLAVVDVKALRFAVVEAGGENWYGSAATDIDETGRVSGLHDISSSGSAPFYWDGTAVEIPGTGSDVTPAVASAIDATGGVVGYYHHSGARSDLQPFVFRNGVVIDLGTLGGPTGMALGVNASGTVVGVSTTSSGEFHAFAWSCSGMRDLGSLGTCSGAAAVNDAGVAVGATCVSDEHRYPAVFENGTVELLPGLEHRVGGALDVNDGGQIVGVVEADGGLAVHGFLFVPGRCVTEVAPLAADFMRLQGIADDGTAVGVSSTDDPRIWDHGVLFKDGVLTDLNDLVDDPTWTITSAQAINDCGQIAADATRDGVHHQAVVLVPAVR